MIKLPAGSEYIDKERISDFAFWYLEKDNSIVTEFYNKTRFDPKLPIKRGNVFICYCLILFSNIITPIILN